MRAAGGSAPEGAGAELLRTERHAAVRHDGVIDWRASAIEILPPLFVQRLDQAAPKHVDSVQLL
jgi:hypothetical protein